MTDSVPLGLEEYIEEYTDEERKLMHIPLLAVVDIIYYCK